jgi:hypothetical protein
MIVKFHVFDAIAKRVAARDEHAARVLQDNTRSQGEAAYRVNLDSAAEDYAASVYYVPSGPFRTAQRDFFAIVERAAREVAADATMYLAPRGWSYV